MFWSVILFLATNFEKKLKSHQHALVVMLASVTFSLLFVTKPLRLMIPEGLDGNLYQRGGDVLVSSCTDDCENMSD